MPKAAPKHKTVFDIPSHKVHTDVERNTKFYSSKYWRKTREYVKARHHFCAMCGKRFTKAKEKHCDHINGDCFDNRLENLQVLCISCHSRKTIAHDGGFGRAPSRLPEGRR